MKILIAAPVHQKPHIFKEYLESLNNLQIPVDWKVDRFFVLHNCEELLPMVQGNSLFAIHNTKDKYVTDEVTHRWTDRLVSEVAGMKNAIIQKFLEWDYDYLFLIDSDLVLHPMTLMQLYQADRDIIAECYWTKWEPDAPELPNAWDFNTYEFYSDRNIEGWKNPGIYPVGMTGACTLIKRKVLEAGVNFDGIYNLNMWGEDRHFCARAAVHGFGIWLDTHYPPVHLYRESEYRRYMAEKAGDA